MTSKVRGLTPTSHPDADSRLHAARTNHGIQHLIPAQQRDQHTATQHDHALRPHQNHVQLRRLSARRLTLPLALDVCSRHCGAPCTRTPVPPVSSAAGTSDVGGGSALAVWAADEPVEDAWDETCEPDSVED